MMAKRFIDRRFFSILLLTALSACTSQNSKNRFLLAEKLWQEAKYTAAVTEYERVMQKEEGSELGLQAAYRAAMTETLFLNEHAQAIRKLNRIIDLNKESALAHEAQKQIGEILFSKLDQYEQSIVHYQRMIEFYPDDPHQPEYLFRMGKSQYFLTKFDESIQTYELLRKKFPASEWAPKALYEMGISAQTRGNQRQTQGGAANDSFKEAILRMNQFVAQYPKDELVPQAKFEIATCLEEMDQLDAASQAYQELKNSYPTPQVIEVKLKRIHDRKAQKNL